MECGPIGIAMQKCNNVNDWFHLSDTIEVATGSEDEAIEKVKNMIMCSELAIDLNKMPLGDSGVRIA